MELRMACTAELATSCVFGCAAVQATVYLTPLIGAYLADAVMGRFWVILVFSCVYFIVSGSSSGSSSSRQHVCMCVDACGSVAHNRSVLMRSSVLCSAVVTVLTSAGSSHAGLCCASRCFQIAGIKVQHPLQPAHDTSPSAKLYPKTHCNICLTMFDHV
jgi:hypothetical protein